MEGLHDVGSAESVTVHTAYTHTIAGDRLMPSPQCTSTLPELDRAVLMKEMALCVRRCWPADALGEQANEILILGIADRQYFVDELIGEAWS